MNRYTGTNRPWYFWPLIAGVIGLLIGWFVIGWGIWPVTWKNTLPQDLRPVYRDEYLSMAAESYARYQDLALARERLADWPADELEESLITLRDARAYADPTLAGDIENLGTALGLGGLVPLPEEEPEEEQQAGSDLLTIVLWLAIVALAVIVFVYLFRRWRAAHTGDQGPAIADGGRQASVSRRIRGEESTAGDIAERAKEDWPAQEVEVPERQAEEAASAPRWPASSRVAETSREPAAPDRGARVRAPAAAARPARSEPAGPAAVSRPAAARAAGQTALGPKLGDYVAIYQMGEPDYDEAFDINDPVDGYLGQCGLQLNEPVGRNRDQAVAVQVWLWDGSDPDTNLMVLMSEGAYRDTDLRSQQAGEHEVLPVRQGTTFELESHDLVLHGTVEKAEYADQEPYRGVFAELQVRLQVYRRV